MGLTGWFFKNVGWRLLKKAIFRRNVSFDSDDGSLAIIYGDHENKMNFTGVDIVFGPDPKNDTALFKFADGKEMIGTVPNHGGPFPEGIGHGNFTVGEDSGQWIIVNSSVASPDASALFQFLLEAQGDGNFTEAEFNQAVAMIKDEAKPKSA